MTKRSFPRGEYIFREGETGGYAYILAEGIVEIVKTSPTGTIVLKEVEAGSLFGEMAIIDESPRSAGAWAKTDVVVTEIDRASFIQHISANPETALSLMAQLSNYVRTMNLMTAEAVAESVSAAPAREDSDAGQVRPEEKPIAEVVEDTDALYDRSPSRPLFLGALAIVAFIAATVAFASLTFVDTTVSARGKFTTKVPNVEVQATSNAVIESLNVERGQQVSRGDVLGVLDGTFVQANLRVVKDKLNGVEQRITRIKLEQKLINSGEAIPPGHGLDEVNLDILSKRLDEYRSQLSSFKAQEELSTVEQRITRIKLEQKLINSGKAIPPGHGLDEFTLDMLSKRLDEYRSHLSFFEMDATKLNQEVATAQISVAISEEQLKIKREVEEARKQLYDKNYGSLLNYLSSRDTTLIAKRGLISARNAMKNLRSIQALGVAERQAFVAKWSAELAERLAKEDELRVRIAEEYTKLENERQAHIAKWSTELAEKLAKEEELRVRFSGENTKLENARQAYVAKWSVKLAEQLAKEEGFRVELSEDKVKQESLAKGLLVRSPVDGVVLDLPTVTAGSIVREGETLITLVRLNVPLALEIDIDPKDVSDLRLGAPVSVKLDALPFQQFGDLPGTLVFISNDTYEEALSGEKGAYYRGRVEVEEENLKRLPTNFALMPGMLATADLKVGQRRIITYFTNPIIKNMSQALREPD